MVCDAFRLMALEPVRSGSGRRPGWTVDCVLSRPAHEGTVGACTRLADALPALASCPAVLGIIPDQGVSINPVAGILGAMIDVGAAGQHSSASFSRMGTCGPGGRRSGRLSRGMRRFPV